MAIEKRAARRTKEDKNKLNHLLEIGMVSPNQPGKKNSTYSTRIIPDGTYENNTYPGFNDHPSTQEAIEYSKNIDQSPTGTIWTGLANMIYAEGGFPTWIREATSDLDIAIYWQMAHYQMVNDGNARMSVRTLSRNLGRPYRSIQRCVTRLLEVGLIVKVRQNIGRTPSAYRVIPPSSIAPHSLSKRRIDSGFENIPSPEEVTAQTLEVTAQTLEVTAQTLKGDRAVAQKTKPLQGEVGGGSAGARPATTSRKSMTTPISLIPTIDDYKKKAKAAQNRKLHANRPRIMRTFHEIEVTNEILTEIIKSSPSLLKLFDECVDTNTRFGVFNGAQGAFEAGSWATTPNRLLLTLNVNLSRTSEQFDIRYPAKALEVVLLRMKKTIDEDARRAKIEFEGWKRSELERVNREERELKQAEAAEAEARARRQRQIENLNDLRTRIDLLIPDFSKQVEISGLDYLIFYHSGRTAGVDRWEADLHTALADFSKSGLWEAHSKVEQEALLETWFEKSLF